MEGIPWELICFVSIALVVFLFKCFYYIMRCREKEQQARWTYCHLIENCRILLHSGCPWNPSSRDQAGPQTEGVGQGRGVRGIPRGIHSPPPEIVIL